MFKANLRNRDGPSTTKKYYNFFNSPVQLRVNPNLIPKASFSLSDM